MRARLLDGGARAVIDQSLLVISLVGFLNRHSISLIEP